MPLQYSQDASISKLSFRNVDGKKLGLSEGCLSPNFESYGVLKFILHNDEQLSVLTSLSLVCVTLLLWVIFGSSLFSLVSAFALILYCKYFITSTKKDTLLIVPSIGIHISIEKKFAGFNSYEFLPWDTVEDIFINEVITRIFVSAKSFILSNIYSKGISGWEGSDTISSIVRKPFTREKMPGVYVYKIGQSDWLEQQTEPILTVPGSYWLCHKNNIYKFTFRYHRTVRNAKEFAYGKELMKVVRRIIKSQPRQGQQFCTKHILVIYNHTSWTRQDKMFAMLKFREHTEVATVTRAIMLTVKVIKNDNSVSSNIVFHSKTEQGVIESLKHIKKEYSSNIENSNTIDLENSNNELKINIGDSDKHINNLNVYNNSSNLSSPTTTNDSAVINKCKIAQYNEKSSIRRFTKTEKKNIHKDENCVALFESEKVEQIKYHNNTEKSSLLNQFELNEITDQERNKIQVNSNSADDINGALDEGIIDCGNLPYQYLIEKEIENAKKKIVRIPLKGVNKSICMQLNSTSKSESNHFKKRKKENNQCNKDCTTQKVYVTSQNSIEEHTKDIKCISNNSKECDNRHNEPIKTDYSKCKNTGEIQKKIVVDDNALKSSNITDLIMKGCMFTIQQDKDSVSVLEQNTKSDLDEVLENSEKVETKEGEKCLLNSSLLKLENLVTMIEAPKENITYGDKNKIARSNNIPLHSTLVAKDSITSQHIMQQRSMTVPSMPLFNSQNKPILNQLFDKPIVQVKEHELNVKEISTHNTVTRCMENILENDSGSRNSIIEPSISSELHLKNSVATDMDVAFTPGNTHSIELNKNFVQTNSLSHQNETASTNCINISEVAEITLNTTCNHMSNTPRIISNQIITIDQMPLGLQNIVKSKLSRMNVSTNRTNNSNLQDTQSSTVQSELPTKPEVNTVANCTNTLSINSNNKITEETPISCKRRKILLDCDTKNDSVQMENNEVILHIQEKIYSEIDKMERQKRRKKQDCRYNAEKKMKMPAHISDIINQKYSTMPNKLQDITEEFYQDLMQHHKHNKTVEHKDQRQTRESLYLDTDVEDENMRIEMLKFIEDITRGVKVVVKRMSRKSISSILGKSSSLACIN